MKLIISPISPIEKAIITVENTTTKSIGKWLLVYLWISKNDCKLDQEELNQKIEKVCHKLQNLQLFVWEDDKINTSLKDIDGEILLVSNFTLYGKNKKWNKIDFLDSGTFKDSKKIYDLLVEKLKTNWIKIQTWEFGAYMEIESKNNGPLNYILEF